MIAILIFLGKAFAYFTVSLIMGVFFAWIIGKTYNDEAYYWESDIGGWILVFLILGNTVLWFIDPISHVTVSIFWK